MNASTAAATELLQWAEHLRYRQWLEDQYRQSRTEAEIHWENQQAQLDADEDREGFYR
jgi:hypothetical protein